MAPPEKRTIHRPTRRPLVFLLLGLAVAIGIAAWWFLLRPTGSPTPIATPVAPAPLQITPPTALPSPETGTTPTPEPAAPAPSASPAPTSTPAAQTAMPTARPASGECQQLRTEIRTFFSRLDQEDYIAPRKLSGGSQAYIGRLMDKLFANPPVVVGETNTFFTVLSNAVHFYRILKKDDVLLIKDILLNESENLEPLMALFYRWSLKAQECGAAGGADIAMPLPGLYEYAGFFLNTLGGRSYLFRRESRLRLLVKYYSVLVLDRANGQRLNSHGIDIRPALDSLNEEMRNAKNLKDRSNYLASLADLRGKYRRPNSVAGTAPVAR